MIINTSIMRRLIGTIVAPLFFILGAVFFMSSPLHAVAIISQNYQSASSIPVGAIVSLEEDSTSSVKQASTTSIETLIGVVVDASAAFISLTREPDNEVQVATSGIVQVFVSNINGDIVKGDHITASPIQGVGMKATDNIRVVGIAQSDLGPDDGKDQTYKDSTGAEKTTRIGQVPVLINVSYYFKEPERTLVPSAIQSLANALAGKEVSTVPIILASAIFIVMLIVVVSIIYSMIRSSIISVGRNPLSQSAIYRDLIQLSALVIGILGVGLIAIYLILTRL